jgi:hypothetical protein
MQANDNNFLKVVSKTWGRDSHGLYDYESSQTKVNNMLISKNCNLIRKRNDVKEVSEAHQLDVEERLLSNISIENCIIILILAKSYLSNPIPTGMLPTEDNINELQNKIWYVIKQDDTNNANILVNSNELYDIKLNDIIKLGRVKYVVTEMKMDEKLVSIENDLQYPIFNLICEYQ